MQIIRNDSGFKMTEVWRKWFLLVGLAAGVLIGLNRPARATTFQSDINALVRQSGFVFLGTVKKLNSDTRNAKQDGSIVVVLIDEVLQAQNARAPRRGRTITLQLKEPDSVKMGQQLIFFTNYINIHVIDTTFGQGFNIIEVGRMEDTATLRQQIAAAKQRLADQELQQRIDSLVRQSVFIFRGTVKKLNADTPNANQNSIIVVLSVVASVDEVLQAPAAFVHYRGRTITVHLKETDSVKMGQQLIFFTNVIRIFTSAKGFVITEVGRMEAPASSDTLRQQIAVAKQRLADQELQQRLEINAQSTSTSSAQPKLRLGYVKDNDVGCGSAFSLNATDMGNRRYIFAQDMDDPPYINLNGKNLQLRLTGYSKPKGKEKVGDRSWETYAAGELKVRIDYTVTKVCTPRDEICETTYLNATMTVSQKTLKTTVKLTGRSGC
jgi:hypothetical protein